MAKRAQAGSGVAGLFLILLVMVGALAFNYHRNVQAESQEDRPYRGHATEDLESLLAAYEGRQGTQSARYEAAAGRRAKAQGKAYFDEQVREFERVQRVHRRAAERRDQLAGTQVVVKQIKKELAKRESEGDGLQRFMRLAFSF